MKIIKIEAQIEGEPSPKKKSWNWDKISRVIGIVITVIGLWYTVLQYLASEKWKRAEFVVQQVKNFGEVDCTKLIDQALDYTETTHYKYRDTYVDIDKDKFNKALDTTDGEYVGNALILRNAFDCYFDNLSLFNRYIKSKVMTFKEIKPYLEYYVKIIADTNNVRIDKQSRKQLWIYLNKYDFVDVKELCCLYGYNISSTTDVNCANEKKFWNIF
jgi:hypothetical protein